MSKLNHLIDRNYLLVNLKAYNTEIVEKQLELMASNLVSAVGELLKAQDDKIAELEAKINKCYSSE